MPRPYIDVVRPA
ncbi:hypothetical protein VTH06DRAFT_8809 [Thermothelomyces fergusii]